MGEKKEEKDVSAERADALTARIGDLEVEIPAADRSECGDDFDSQTLEIDWSDFPVACDTVEETQPSETGPLSVLPEDVTSSGSFNLAGVRSAPFTRLLQALPIPVFLVGPAGSIVFANRAATRVRNTPGDLEGSDVLSLFPKGACRSGALVRLEKVLASRTAQVFESTLESDRGKMWARIHLRSLRMGDQRLILVLVEDMTDHRERLLLIQRHQRELLDISRELDRRNRELEAEIGERKKAEALIERAKREWERTFDTVTDLIAIIDRSGRISRLNKAMADALGLDVKDAVGKLLADYFPGVPGPDDLPKKMDGENHAAFDQREVQDPRTDRIFEVCSTPVHDDAGELVGWAQVARDITDRRETERLVMESGRAKAVSELAGVVAHSINNLLQVVMGGAQLALTNLELGNLGDIEQNLEQILQSARLGATTVQRLNYLARAHAETSQVEGRILDLSRIVHQALDITRPWWKTKPEQWGIKIVANRNLGPNCFVRGNESELFEVVVNLVKNAAEALTQGGVIGIRTFVDGDRVVLQVEDNGVGIPESNQDKIFEPFWTSKGAQASGVGLERTKRLVLSHGGEIDVKSEEGKGTTVTVSLPRSEPPGPVAAPVPGELSSRRRILVVDDMEPVVRMLVDGLRKLGHTVFAALSGARALEVFKTHDIDVVICDLGMPGMNGWQVAENLQKIGAERKKPKVPFILLTGWGGQSDNLRKAAENGVDRVLEKPVDLTRLMRVVDELTASSNPDPGSA